MEHYPSQTGMQVIYYLASLTTDDETFIEQAGAQRSAADVGVALVCSDNSPRDIPGIPEQVLLQSHALLLLGQPDRSLTVQRQFEQDTGDVIDSSLATRHAHAC